MKIAELDMPDALKDFYIGSGITELYEPQAEAVKKGLIEGKNLLAAIPTASGKTLLAEMAMIRSVARGGKAIYIVPLKALASEKYDRFVEFSNLNIKEGGVRVGIATGDYDSKDEWLGEKDIIVATSEKTDSLLRNGATWLSNLSVVVADEVHLIDSANRGPTLEVTIAKLMKLNPDIQVLALSATIGNAKSLAKWMKAELVLSEWRPTKLKEGVFFGRAIKFTNDKRVLNSAGPDEVLSLVTDTLEEGGQCLVFANTRKSSESIAQKLARSLSKKLTDEQKADFLKIRQQVMSHAETDICEKLANCVACGVAFHHAGLKSEHRRIVEDSFKKNIIKVIACTPTLAAGLNLPARRVIIRDYKRFDVNYGSVPIPVLEYKQMAGRAGRPRLDPYGEAVLIAKNYDEFEELMENYVLAGPEQITSRLGTEPAMRAHVLSAVATDFCRSRDDIKEFMDTTFFAYQRGDLSSVLDNVLDFLKVENMIVESKGGSLKATELGKLTSRLYIDPLSSSIIVKGLESAKKKKDDNTEFGMLHLICSTPDIKQLYLKRNDYSWIAKYTDQHISDFLIDIPDSYADEIDFEQFLSSVKTAALAEMWINEKSEEEITSFYGIGPGDIRNLMDTCVWLMHATAEISGMTGAPVTRLSRELGIRLENGASRELLDLIELSGVGRVRARSLYDAGYTSREKLKGADLKSLAAIPAIGEKLAAGILGQLGRKVDHVAPEEPEQTRTGQSTLFSFDE
ncbi:extensin [Methanocella sp. CWC-04]|uniref:ATP-dependent DNA helicase Hel308 n=1 Tax=Methanooceanicella nereidis TaxID=2052831 RepID=A0AAP2W6Q4_9EURY|nr:ATP-dependent DNA helicase [Methanocella sp. CWC-04]MCD1294509.1 extensin [Methanocella sp. CWC-04]